ncbi:MAG: molybdenum cofactor guanylyltransferase [Myxococcota bacterium]|nr:molybdenum cofactor guanylyltransferase [Myxococcota bacterium]
MAGDRLASVTGALLLGGASSRMGGDKASRPVGGVPAATRLARRLDALFEEVLLVGGHPPADAPGRRVPDPTGGPRCALRGLVGALEAAQAPHVLVLATDQLVVTPALLLALAARADADAVVPVTEGRVQPLCAVYRREAVLPVARGHLAEGRLALRGLLEVLDVAWLEGADLEAVAPGGTALRAANTPEAWDALEAALSRRGEAPR